MNNIGVYIHWPFCQSKCPYCDFNSHVPTTKIDYEIWLTSYLTEIDYFNQYFDNAKINSVFFGGGTPSLMPPFLVEKILEYLGNKCRLSSDIEITLEANPTSVEAGKFAAFAKSGINRVSIGIQSLDNDALKFLGRTHSKNEALKALEIAQNYFNNYSFDLIYARPGQSLKAWHAELNEAIKLAQYHISLYQLTIEKGTKFFSDYKKHKFTMPSDNLTAEMYQLTKEMTSKYGFIDYEISNYAKPGFESKHNLAYWQYDDYIGIGPGAHSRVNRQAIMMIHSPEKWLSQVKLQGHAIQQLDKLTTNQIFEEYILMNLRTKLGINKEKFFQLFNNQINHFINLDNLQFFKQNDLLLETKTHIATTDKGRLVLNKIIELLTK